MPYAGVYRGDTVSPLSVPGDGVVFCPACGGEMRVRGAHRNNGQFISRHFYHLSNDSNCGGESAIHLWMKTVAVEKFKRLYPDSRVEAERGIGDRIADVRVTFDAPRVPYGNGIVVEVQHKHKTKDTRAVTQEYFEHGYSVLWAYQSDFSEHDMEIAEHRMQTVWPDAVLRDRNWSGSQSSSVVTEEELREMLVEQGVAVSDGKMDVRFPREIWRVVAQRISPEGLVENASWSECGQAWLHGKGTDLAWFTVFQSPGGELWCEAHTHTKGADSSDDSVVVWMIDPACDERIRAFRERVVEFVGTGGMSPPGGHDGWATIESVTLSGERAGEWVRLGFVRNPRGKLGWTYSVESPYGYTSRVWIPYRYGDEKRLKALSREIREADGR